MNTQQDFERIIKLLEEHSQGHLPAFWSELDPEQKQNLAAQLQRLNFDEIDKWIEKYVKNPSPASVPVDFEPARSYSPTPRRPSDQKKYDQAIESGNKLISDGKVAAFVVAGGQGTRLGFDGPKGDFPITPVKNKTLFQLFADTIAAAAEKYQTKLGWYIMTSPLNYTDTIEIFEANSYYGLDEENVFIFQQGTMPNFDLRGRILLAAKDRIACSPDGHGGSLKALYAGGAIEDMKKHGVEYISYFQVDNPLVNIFDPLFIGLHVLDGAEMSSKALLKAGPKERVGNFCMVDGKVTVIEYSDLPDELAEKRNPDGSLVFGLGSIAIHMINTGFVEKLNTEGFALPLHRAVKKIPFIDANGRLIGPDRPNGVKLETFVFDALPLASKSIILETIRSEEFAPVKNASGTDSSEVARQMMTERAAAWLESAGIAIPRKPDGSVDAVIEIAPNFAISSQDVQAKKNSIAPIKPGDKIYLA